MSICTNCQTIMSEEEYGAEGLCSSCHYDSIMDLDPTFEEFEEQSLEEELEPYVDEIIEMLYTKD